MRVTVLAVAAATAAAVLGITQPVRGAAAPAPTRATGSVASKPVPAISVGLVGAGATAIEVVHSLPGGRPRTTTVLSDPDAEQVVDTALAADGNSGLVATDDSSVLPLANLRTTPTMGTPIDLSGFLAESGSVATATSSGVAISGRTALVGVYEQGLVQLRNTGGQWAIDTRVQSPGTNDSGDVHQPGFIRIPTTASNAIRYLGIRISPTPLPNGDRLAVAVDDDDANTLAILDHVGTGKPRVVSTLQLGADTRLDGDYGDGGVEFSPVTAARAVVATRTGFFVLDLTHPAHPVVRSITTTPTGNRLPAISISPNGNYVAWATDETAYVFAGLRASHLPAHLHQIGSFITFAGEQDITDVHWLANDRIAAVATKQIDFNAPSAKLTIVDQATTAAPTLMHSLSLTAYPYYADTLSVWPTADRARLAPAHLVGPKARVSRRVSTKLSVTHGIGRYHFRVSHGSLPKGLHLVGARVKGLPKRAGVRHVTITAKNQYGVAVSRNYTVTIHHRRSRHHVRA